MQFPRTLALLPLALLTSPLWASTSVSGFKGAGQARLSPALILQDAEYQANDDFDVEGTILSLAYKAAINPRLALGGGIGLMLDGELGRGNKIDNGEGYRLFFDGQYEVKTFAAGQLLATFGLAHDRFSFDTNGVDVDFTMTDLRGGALFMHRIDTIALYGGLDVFLLSDGKLETKVANNRFSTDAERDNRLDLHLGAAVALDSSFDLRADLLLLGEETLSLAVDIAL